MRLVVKKAEREHLFNCCHRQPIVGATIDFAEEYEPSFDIFCPVCERCVVERSFQNARDKWNYDIVSANWIRK